MAVFGEEMNDFYQCVHARASVCVCVCALGFPVFLWRVCSCFEYRISQEAFVAPAASYVGNFLHVTNNEMFRPAFQTSGRVVIRNLSH